MNLPKRDPFPPLTLEFTKPGSRTIKVINGTAAPIALKNILFAGDQFSTPLTKHGVSMGGIDSCAKIPLGASCKFTINAEANASPSIYPDGQQFFIAYSSSNKAQLEPAEFIVKINYNHDISFKIRNLSFAKKQRGFMRMQNPFYNPANSYLDFSNLSQHQPGTNAECFYQELPTTKKLTIVNKSPLEVIDITTVYLDEPKAGITIGDYAHCKNLTNGGSCEVEIAVDYDEPDTAIPIRVVYNTNSKKELVATAAIIITQNYEYNKGKTDLYSATLGGLSLSTYLNLQKLSFTELPKLVGAITRIGTAYSSTDFYNPLESNYIKAKDYEGSHLPNLIVEEGIKNLVSIYFKWPSFNRPTEALEYIPKFSCAVLANLITRIVMDFVFADGNYLPEEGEWSPGFLNGADLIEYKKTISFSVKNLLRESCIGTLNLAFGLPNKDFLFNFLVNAATLLRVGNAIDDILNKQRSAHKKEVNYVIAHVESC